MNHKLLLIFVFLSFCISSFSQAQNGWFSQVSGTNYNLRSVSFVNANTGYAVGGITTLPIYTDDVFLKTTDGGSNWIINPSWIFGDQDLFATCFWNENTGYVTARGIDNSWPFPNYVRILKTTDGGIVFNPYLFPIGFTELYHVFLTGSESGYIAGEAGRVIKIHSTGYSVKATGYSNDLYASNFLDTATGFAVGSNGLILKTTNGGNNWSSISSGTTNELRSIYFANNTIGYIAGRYGTFLKTTNGGSNWFSMPTGNSYSYWSVCFTSIDTGYISSNVIYKTINGGVNWETQTVPSSVPLNSMCFPGIDTGFVAGNSGVILKTVTGGTTNITQLSNEIPDGFVLFQNYPNPFNPTTMISYQLSVISDVKLIVYDMLGREVATLVNKKLSAGSYEVDWDGSGYTSGVYFYQLITDKNIATKKMVLIK